MQQKRLAKMAREARHFVDEAFFVIFGKYLAEFSKKLFNFVRQPYKPYFSRKKSAGGTLSGAKTG